ncbi:MAG: YggT family protein, partial [Motiliproteus sp.]|nr:YggT family protein [Motiliproteus sp.]
QMSHADFYNPISQAVAKMTSVPIAPIRAVCPAIAGKDFSALILAILVKFATFMLLFVVAGQFPNVLSVIVMALVSTLSTVLDIYFYAVIASVIVSWVAPNSYHPAPQLIGQLTEPVFSLARKVIPPIGGLDLSPILIFLAIQVIQLQLSQILH